MSRSTLKLAYVLLGTVVYGQTDKWLSGPLYQWPFGNISVADEVIYGENKMIIADDKKCFKFGPNFKHLPYDALAIGTDSVTYFSVTLKNEEPFEDLAISVFLFPVGTPDGTLIHYAVGEDEKIRVAFDKTNSLTVISFRDEYDNPTGIVAIENLLNPNTWNHLVIQRVFSSGGIQVFVDSELRENADDNFQDEVPVPAGGTLLVGSTRGPSQQFKGYISCLQIFSHLFNQTTMNDAWKMCTPERWNYTPKVKLKPDPQNRHNFMCLDESELCTITTLTNEQKWRKMKQQYGWTDSQRKTSYFTLLGKERSPPTSALAFGIVDTTDLRTCARLCMRVMGCQSFVAESQNGGISRHCKIYRLRHSNLVHMNDSNYYEIVR